MRSEFLLGLLLVVIVVVGCLEGTDTSTVAPGVLSTERSYYEGSVWITERAVSVNGQYQTTVTYQGSATNYGEPIQDVRYELLAADGVDLPDGSTTWRDEGVVATQILGDMPRNKVSVLSLSYTYPSVAKVRFRARLTWQ